MACTTERVAEAVESREYPYWQHNLKVLPLANFMCSMGEDVPSVVEG